MTYSDETIRQVLPWSRRLQHTEPRVHQLRAPKAGSLELGCKQLGRIPFLTSRVWHAGRGHGTTRFATRTQPILTPSANGPTDDFTRESTDDDSLDGYEWTCPYCEETRIHTANNRGAETNALAGLRGHIQTSDDGNHEPKYEFPVCYYQMDMSAHVERVE